ncbi:cytochrome c [Flavobacteriaceae bacterium 3-367]|uniref:c-type cytochrome n=1 Tax=Eudoraea algarum TaxID=3417568 RepID=UPI00328A68D3
MRAFLFTYLALAGLLSLYLIQDTPLKQSMKRGSGIYLDFCVSCHLEKGEGVENTYPPLANSDYLINNRKKSIIGVKYGQQGEIVVNGTRYDNTMLPMGLSDEEVADVMNYIMNSWGNKSNQMVTPEEVSNCLKR